MVGLLQTSCWQAREDSQSKLLISFAGIVDDVLRLLVDPELEESARKAANSTLKNLAGEAFFICKPGPAVDDSRSCSMHSRPWSQPNNTFIQSNASQRNTSYA